MSGVARDASAGQHRTGHAGGGWIWEGVAMWRHLTFADYEGLWLWLGDDSGTALVRVGVRRWGLSVYEGVSRDVPREFRSQSQCLSGAGHGRCVDVEEQTTNQNACVLCALWYGSAVCCVFWPLCSTFGVACCSRVCEMCVYVCVYVVYNVYVCIGIV
jgi:hypothetical protein